jgi:hypothetical protein
MSYVAPINVEESPRDILDRIMERKSVGSMIRTVVERDGYVHSSLTAIDRDTLISEDAAVSNEATDNGSLSKQSSDVEPVPLESTLEKSCDTLSEKHAVATLNGHLISTPQYQSRLIPTFATSRVGISTVEALAIIYACTTFSAFAFALEALITEVPSTVMFWRLAVGWVFGLMVCWTIHLFFEGSIDKVPDKVGRHLGSLFVRLLRGISLGGECDLRVVR